MKQKDITLIVIVAIFSLVVALVASSFLFGGAKAKTQQAEVVEPISAAFTQPDTRYFNDQSIDPTEVIRIDNNANQTPFNQPTR